MPVTDVLSEESHRSEETLGPKTGGGVGKNGNRAPMTTNFAISPRERKKLLENKLALLQKASREQGVTPPIQKKHNNLVVLEEAMDLEDSSNDIPESEQGTRLETRKSIQSPLSKYNLKNKKTSSKTLCERYPYEATHIFQQGFFFFFLQTENSQIHFFLVKKHHLLCCRTF